jgi:hypothetical protein
MTFDLHVWALPREVDAARADALIVGWQSNGGDPASSPFEPSSDVGWFVWELMHDHPGLEVVSDAVPNARSGPLWLSTEPEPPARVASIRLPPDPSRDLIDTIVGLGAKYDLVLYDVRNATVHAPLDEMAAHADATFWPGGALQAALAGGAGLLIAVFAFLVAIPLVSGLLIVVGAFLVVMAVYTFVRHGRATLQERRGGGRSGS